MTAEMDRLQHGDIVNRETVQKHEQFQWFLAPALALFLIAELIPARKVRGKQNAFSNFWNNLTRKTQRGQA